jgi:excisionase family DNA binding protein
LSSNPGQKAVMNLQEVADYLHCHYSTVYRLIRRGRLPVFRLGRDYRFLRSEIDNWIVKATMAESKSKKKRFPTK